MSAEISKPSELEITGTEPQKATEVRDVREGPNIVFPRFVERTTPRNLGHIADTSVDLLLSSPADTRRALDQLVSPRVGRRGTSVIIDASGHNVSEDVVETAIQAGHAIVDWDAVVAKPRDETQATQAPDMDWGEETERQLALDRQGLLAGFTTAERAVIITNTLPVSADKPGEKDLALSTMHVVARAIETTAPNGDVVSPNERDLFNAFHYLIGFRGHRGQPTGLLPEQIAKLQELPEPYLDMTNATTRTLEAHMAKIVGAGVPDRAEPDRFNEYGNSNTPTALRRVAITDRHGNGAALTALATETLWAAAQRINNPKASQSPWLNRATGALTILGSEKFDQERLRDIAALARTQGITVNAQHGRITDANSASISLDPEGFTLIGGYPNAGEALRIAQQIVGNTRVEEKTANETYGEDAGTAEGGSGNLNAKPESEFAESAGSGGHKDRNWHVSYTGTESTQLADLAKLYAETIQKTPPGQAILLGPRMSVMGYYSLDDGGYLGPVLQRSGVSLDPNSALKQRYEEERNKILGSQTEPKGVISVPPLPKSIPGPRLKGKAYDHEQQIRQERNLAPLSYPREE